MLTLEQIENQYPENLRPFKRNILREYLQYKVLEIVFSSKLATKLSFLGGTALRMIYGNSRFSEDLDFDNFELTKDDFGRLADVIRAGMESQGFQLEVATVSKGAYRCNIHLPELLFHEGLSGHREEKILIQVDSAAHHFEYVPDRKMLNKFDVFLEIFVTPADIILSQKIYAAINRKRAKGRDFYDIVYLSSFAKPNYPYLKFKLNIHGADELKDALMHKTESLDLKELGRDVKNFLINARDVQRIEMFRKFIDEVDWENTDIL